jgi:hypothetical protein
MLSVTRDNSLPCYNKTMANLEDERWLDVPGFEGFYQASSMGRLRSVDRVVPHPRHKEGQFVAGRILSQSVSFNRNIKTGEPMVDLRVSFNLEGVQYYFNTRRIIFQTFVNSSLDFEKDGLYVINVDGNGYNNRLENLAAVSKSEKQKRVFIRDRHDSHLKTADRSKWTKPYGGATLRKPVKQFLNGELINRFNSISEAARLNGCGEKEIIMVLKHRWKHHHGYQWEYENPTNEGPRSEMPAHHKQ